MPQHRREDSHASDDLAVNPLYTRGALHHAVPRLRIPEGEIDAETAASIVRDELLLDGSARLNLATFVTTWMEPAAAELMAETIDKNMIDKDEYPQTAGLSFDRPNLVMGINVQVCWEKFCRYWDVEPRYVPMEPGRLHLTAEEAVARCDENTIGVVAILGSTQDGSYEPVADICAALDALQTRGGPDVPVHVDAASGGFVAPFLQPDLVWDFQLPRVASINASGHKYGLVYPGVGWVLWRDPAALPDELVFHVNYLGGSMPTFALNFSRPGAQVVAQYYQFLRLGREGFRRVQQTSQDVARHLAHGVAGLGAFELLSDGTDLPVFAFRLTDEVTNFTVFDVSDGLRKRGWQLPAYTFPENLQHMAVLRAVVRNGFTRDLADLLLADLRRELSLLEKLPASPPGHPHRSRFHH